MWRDLLIDLGYNPDEMSSEEVRSVLLRHREYLFYDCTQKENAWKNAKEKLNQTDYALYRWGIEYVRESD